MLNQDIVDKLVSQGLSAVPSIRIIPRIKDPNTGVVSSQRIEFSQAALQMLGYDVSSDFKVIFIKTNYEDGVYVDLTLDTQPISSILGNIRPVKVNPKTGIYRNAKALKQLQLHFSKDSADLENPMNLFLEKNVVKLPHGDDLILFKVVSSMPEETVDEFLSKVDETVKEEIESSMEQKTEE